MYNFGVAIVTLCPFQDPFLTADAAEKSEMLGVSAGYLLGDFSFEARDAAQDAFENPSTYDIDANFPVQDPSDPNFYELKGLSHKGDKAKGYGKTCPRDEQVHKNTRIIVAL